jgi:thiol-disulfide isomerase/thioredoxin
MFHGLYCSACQQACPEIKEAATKTPGMVHFGEVETGSEYTLASRFVIYQIPTFYIVHPGGEARPQDYPNPRSILNAESNRIPSLAIDVNESWLNASALRATILFTEK